MAVEIDENELAGYKALTARVQAWMGNPEARRKVLEATKLIDPNAVIPELDAAKPINDAMGKLSEDLAAFRKEVSEERTKREEHNKLLELNSKWESGRVKLRGEGYTEDGIKKIEELMEKEGIANHEAGAAYFDRINPPEQPIMPTDSGFDMLKESFMPNGDANAEADRKALFENPDAWLNKAVTNTLRDVRKK